VLLTQEIADTAAPPSRPEPGKTDEAQGQNPRPQGNPVAAGLPPVIPRNPRGKVEGMPSLPILADPSQGSSKATSIDSPGEIAGIAIAGVVAVIVLVALLLFMIRRRRNSATSSKASQNMRVRAMY
jgi:hypothetical protein